MYPDQYQIIFLACVISASVLVLFLHWRWKVRQSGLAAGVDQLRQQRGHPAADKIISGIQLYFFRTDPESGRRESRYVPL